MPPAEINNTEIASNKEKGNAAETLNAIVSTAGEIRPDPDYEFRRQAMDIMQEWQSHDGDNDEDKSYRENMMPKVRDLVRHNLSTNAEIEACDLLMEIERADILLEMMKEQEHMDYERICLYLIRFLEFRLFSYSYFKLCPIYA